MENFRAATGNFKDKKGKIKRPMNAFLVWSKVHRPIFSKANPSLSISELSVQLGIEWSKLSQEQKTPYYEESLRLKQEHTKRFPDWEYKPLPLKRKRLDPEEAQIISTSSCTSSVELPQSSAPHDVPETSLQTCVPPGNFKDKKGKIKRPMNAFLVWSKIHRPIFSKANPSLSISELSVQLGIEWSKLSEEERRPYYEESLRLKQEHTKRFPDWEYKPLPLKRKRLDPEEAQINSTSSSTPWVELLQSSVPHDVPETSLRTFPSQDSALQTNLMFSDWDNQLYPQKGKGFNPEEAPLNSTSYSTPGVELPQRSASPDILETLVQALLCDNGAMESNLMFSDWDNQLYPQKGKGFDPEEAPLNSTPSVELPQRSASPDILETLVQALLSDDAAMESNLMFSGSEATPHNIVGSSESPFVTDMPGEVPADGLVSGSYGQFPVSMSTSDMFFTPAPCLYCDPLYMPESTFYQDGSLQASNYPSCMGDNMDMYNTPFKDYGISGGFDLDYLLSEKSEAQTPSKDTHNSTDILDSVPKVDREALEKLLNSLV